MLVRQITIPLKAILVSILVITGTAIPAFWRSALADTMSSSSFEIQADTLSVGGNWSTSASFGVHDTIGEDATGENLLSASFAGCSGYHCFVAPNYLAFSIKEGTSSPGSAGAGVDLGDLSLLAVVGSDGSTINSIFLTSTSTARSGTVIQVKSEHGGLGSITHPGTVLDSVTETLSAADEGYGICIFATTLMSKVAPYNNANCTKTTGHSVGELQITSQNILTTTGPHSGDESEILVKSSISGVSPGGDYQDNLTFTIYATF